LLLEEMMNQQAMLQEGVILVWTSLSGQSEAPICDHVKKKDNQH
jgi:hypothetical protein